MAPRAPEFPERLDAPQEIETPGVTTIEALAEHLGIDAAATSKAMPVVTGDRFVLALVRGDDRLSEEKLETLFEASFRPATDEEIRAAFGGGGAPRAGWRDFEVIADEALREGQFVAGANRDGWHVRGVEAGRDFEPTFADIRQARRATLSRVRRPPRRAAGDRGRSHLQARHVPLPGARREVLDEDGRRSRSSWAATDRAGPTIAAIVEQHHDERGIVWPRSVAPYDAHVVVLPGLEERGEEVAVALGRRPGRAAGRPRPARRREVRRRRPDRHPDADHGRQEDARGRRRTSATGPPARSGAYPSPKLETR